MSKGLDFINQKVPTTHFDYAEIETYSHSLITKFNLHHINLTDIKPHKAMAFLVNLDKNLTHVCESLGVTYDVIGIKKNVGISASPHTDACFTPNNNNISVGGFLNSSSTMLHEWIHALDYHVGHNVKSNTYASQINTTININDSNKSQAFISVKKLTQEIFSKDSSNIETIKEGLFKKGTSAFFSEVMGYDFYLLPEDVKQTLHSKETFMAVNNYLLVSDSTNNQNEVLRLLASQNISNDAIIHKIEHPNSNMTKLITFFDAVNVNIQGEESFYHLYSRFSKYGLKLNNYIVDTFTAGLHYMIQTKVKVAIGNGNDEDYLTQPSEMLARYFESQIFPKTTMASNILNVITGIQIYKLTLDDSFEKNKNTIIEHVFGRDKIMQNIKAIRKNPAIDMTDLTLGLSAKI